LHNDNIVKMRALQDTIYMAALARELKGLGYEIRYEKNHIELAHITREQIEHFSKRSRDIGQQLAIQGLHRSSGTHAVRQVATLRTRNPKSPAISREALAAQRKIQPTEVGRSPGREASVAKERALHQPQAPIISQESRDHMTQAALTWAIKHHSERETVMEHDTLIATALTHAEGLITPEDLNKAVRRFCQQDQLITRADRFICNTDPNGKALTRQGWAQAYAQSEGIALTEALERVNKAIANGRFSRIARRYATKAAYESEQQILAMEKTGRQC